jgi:hypothetical protein
MVDSARVGAVVDECTAWASELVVQGDGGGEGAEAGEDSFSEARRVRAPWRSRVRRPSQVQEMLSTRRRIGARCGPGPGCLCGAV